MFYRLHGMKILTAGLLSVVLATTAAALVLAPRISSSTHKSLGVEWGERRDETAYKRLLPRDQTDHSSAQATQLSGGSLLGPGGQSKVGRAKLPSFPYSYRSGPFEPLALSVGARVQTNDVVNVRQAPAGSVLGKQAFGRQGTVIGGPQTASLTGTSYRWLNINFDSGLDGWVADIGLSALNPQTLIVSLSANPSSGSAPLNGVSLTATVSGSATGTINYTFYCDRSDSGTNITSGWAKKYDGVTTNPKTASGVCSYSKAGTYRAKVIVERGSAPAAEARFTITVTAPPTLSVSLSANPSSGSAPLNGVSLTATVSGTATGTINYTFYCDRSDSGTNITSGWAKKYDGITTNPKTASGACSYSKAGTYRAKVIVEHGSAPAAEARFTITVTAPPTLGVSLSANPSSGSAPLNAVSLTATVGGTATGSINYTFYCDRSDSGTNITSGWAKKYDGVTTNPKTASGVCSYSKAGTYRAKVIVERGNAPAAEARLTIQASGAASGRPLGIDVSEFQGMINWSQVRDQGKRTFAFVRASAGKNTDDRRFLQNVAEAKSAGLLVGAYHFAYPEAFSAHEEAQKFLSVARSTIGVGYLPPALDIEDSAIVAENSHPYRMGSIALSQWIRDWCLEIEMATGVKPLIYSTRWYANNHFRLDLIQYGFWVATYPADPSSNPSSITPWITWTFQQYRTDPTTQKTDPDLTTEPLVAGTCPGIQGYVDLDSFNGDLAGLKALAGLP